ncbi:adenylyl-sulfate kinase [Burkholderia sp. MSMB617WGS]|uniref:adenylyl-sulfate kinase n=1 Tax=Burkholderia sp. MSMB617WGS TaxID=1637831 RepID=UPI00075FC7BD|nr:adenylyl-sulfate kinase [Burkholderia sp. MSMB617WGS]AOK46574.1 adenylyl-sulfate kinase [Burkholderia sp. MSMB617WGS]
MDMNGGFPPEAVAPVVWMTGLPGAGKTTTANALLNRLLESGAKAIVLDGDALRTGLCSDLGFSDADRMENIRRFAHVAKLFQHEGYIVIVATISPLQAHRDLARSIVGTGFFETYVSTPLEVCRARDPKGMYARAEQGRLMQFTGVSGAYEPPVAPDISIDTSNCSVALSLADVMAQLMRVTVLPAKLGASAQVSAALAVPAALAAPAIVGSQLID